MTLEPSQDETRERATRFVQQLTIHQRELYTYINTLLVGQAAASDVLQDTNLDLWVRRENYDFQRPFAVGVCICVSAGVGLSQEAAAQPTCV